MSPELTEQIVRGTARLAVAAWVCRLLADVESGRFARRSAGTAVSAQRQPSPGTSVVLWIWTAGCLIYLVHVAAAFHFVHDWSHTAAREHTARQTELVTGWHWGGGLWINYAFTLWWPLDLLWSWKRSLDHLPRWYLWTLHGIVGFLMFNATVVFGPPWWKWAAALLALLLLLRLGRQPRRATP